MRFCYIHLRAISQRVRKLLFCIMHLKSIFQNLLPLTPMANYTFKIAATYPIAQWINKSPYQLEMLALTSNTEYSSKLIRVQTIVSHTRILPGIPFLASHDCQWVIHDITRNPGFSLIVYLFPIPSPRDGQVRSFHWIRCCFTLQDCISACIDYLI